MPPVLCAAVGMAFAPGRGLSLRPGPWLTIRRRWSGVRLVTAGTVLVSAGLDPTCSRAAVGVRGHVAAPVSRRRTVARRFPVAVARVVGRAVSIESRRLVPVVGPVPAATVVPAISDQIDVHAVVIV